MDNTVLLALIGIAEMVVTSVVTFLLTRRKYKTEVKECEIHNDGYKIENDEKKFDLYVKMINDNNIRIDELQEENRDLRRQVAEMRSVVFSMLQQICTDMMCQNRKFDQEQCPYYDALFNLRNENNDNDKNNNNN